jgi:hypothetical protein
MIDAHGGTAYVEILFSVIKERIIGKAVGIIESCQSNAFYSIEDAKSVNKGIFPHRAPPASAIRRKKGVHKQGKLTLPRTEGKPPSGRPSVCIIIR